jgi:hypothetical protein
MNWRQRIFGSGRAKQAQRLRHRDNPLILERLEDRLAPTSAPTHRISDLQGKPNACRRSIVPGCFCHVLLLRMSCLFFPFFMGNSAVSSTRFGATDGLSNRCSMRQNPQQRSTAILTVCWGAWIGGTILIVLSWGGIVPNDIGWVGFGVAGVAALISYIPAVSSPAASRGETDGAFALNDPMLNSQDRHYQTAMDQFRQGATLIYRGVGFAFCEPNEIAATLMASHPAADMDDSRVLEDAAHARKAFEDLEQRSSHFAFAVRDRVFRVSLFCDYGKERVEICRIRGDSIRWLIDRHEQGGQPLSESLTARRPMQ